MNEQSPVIPETDSFEIDYSYGGAEMVRLSDYARNIHLQRKKLRKSDVVIHTTASGFLRSALIFALITVTVIAFGYIIGAFDAGLTVAGVPGVSAVLCLVFAAVNCIATRRAVKKNNNMTTGRLTISADGIRDESDGSTHSFPWDKTESCVITEKVTVFIFRDANVIIFIPSTEDSKQTVITAFRRFGRFDDVLMRSVK